MKPDMLLDHRTLSNVTSNGVAASRDLRGALDAAWRTLDKIVDDDGQLAEQLDADGRVLADPLAPFKATMKEAAIQAEFYRRNYRPVAWPDAHRRRAERIERVLAPSGFMKAFVGASAFRAAGTGVSRRR